MRAWIGIAAPMLVLLTACDGHALGPARGTVDLQGNSDDVLVPDAGNDAAAMANAAASASPVTLAPDGLRVTAQGSSAHLVAFGAPRAETTQALRTVLGAPLEEGDNQDCGAGALSFASFRGGLSLYFQDGVFAGWDVDGREAGGFSTTNGVAIGTTRRALDAAGQPTFAQSSIGNEFMLGELSGLLDGTGAGARVTNLWAGVTCIAR